MKIVVPASKRFTCSACGHQFPSGKKCPQCRSAQTFSTLQKLKGDAGRLQALPIVLPPELCIADHHLTADGRKCLVCGRRIWHAEWLP